MANSSSPAGGGVMIAGGAVLGTIVGLVLGQPTLGMLSGLAIGVAIALAIWLVGRGREVRR